MEFLSGPTKIKDIFLHNNNWFNFFNKSSHLLRPAIIENVAKLLSCRTPLLGFQLFSCPICHTTKKIPHSCKSRFCTSCGKAQTDSWIAKALNTLPDVTYQHITFTMPDAYWNLFRTNRFLLNQIPRLAAHIVIDICKKGNKRKPYLPGIFLAIHTFGRDVKHNVHIHLSTTVGGFIIKKAKTTNTYTKGSVINEKVIKNMWKYQITNLLRTAFKEKKLKPYPSVVKHFENLTTFNKWLDSHYQKTWNVFLQKTQQGAKHTVDYLSKYLKRPPIAETRILAYDGSNVTFSFFDHYSDTIQTKTLSVTDFIKTLICHIPDKHFKMIRYYGFLANRVRSKYLKRLKTYSSTPKSTYLSYLKRFIKAFHYNPLKCSCGASLQLTGIFWAIPISTLILRHNKKAAFCRGP